jgi:hypothetical protein
MCARKVVSIALSAFRAAGVALLALGCSSGGNGTAPVDASAVSAADGSAGDALATDDADGADGDGGSCGVPPSFQWTSTGPLLGPVSNATHDLVAIKDPSVVYFGGRWHVFVSTVDTAGTTASRT